MLKGRRRLCGVTAHFPKLGQPPSSSLPPNTAGKSCPKVQSMCCKPSLPIVKPSGQVLSGTQWCLWALQLQLCFHIKINELVNVAVSFGHYLRIHGLSYFWFHFGFSPFPGETDLNQQNIWCSWKEILIQGPDPESSVCLTPAPCLLCPCTWAWPCTRTTSNFWDKKCWKGLNIAQPGNNFRVSVHLLFLGAQTAEKNNAASGFDVSRLWVTLQHLELLSVWWENLEEADKV